MGLRYVTSSGYVTALQLPQTDRPLDVVLLSERG
jgi:hypothetical protein